MRLHWNLVGLLILLCALQGHECNICETCICSSEAASVRNVDCEGKRLVGKNTLSFDLLMFDEELRLSSLNLARNGIPTVPMDMFRNLNNLKHLNLSSNHIQEIPSTAFNDLESLVELDLSRNDLSVLPAVIFSEVAGLEKLYLQYNHINELDPEIGSLTELTWLDASHNGLTHLINNSFETLIHLRHLDLSFNKITSLGDNNLMELSELRTLLLNNNNLMYISPQELPTSVTTLSLGHNALTLVPYTLTNLEILNVENNDISGLDSLPFNQIKSLNLSGNKLTDFPNVKLEYLKTLDLSFNQLGVVPESLGTNNFPQLRTLIISGNPIRKLRFASELSLEWLVVRSLDLFESIDEDSFTKLSSVKPGACLNLTISRNKHLATIHEDALEGVNVCSLDLSGNKLESISPALIKPLSDANANYTIDLQGNPFHCDCSLQWMLADLVPKLYSIDPELLDDLRCASPPNLENQRFVHWYKWEERVFCENSSILLSKMTVQTASVMSGNGDTIKLESSIGMLAAVIGAVVVLSMLVTIGIVMARRIALQRSRKNRRF